MREFRKIQHDSKGLLIVWDTPIEGEEEEGLYESQFKTKQEPHPAFYKALKGLAVHVPPMMELPDDQYKERIMVTGVSISHRDDGSFGVSIQAKAGLDCGQTIALNTPHLRTDGEAHEMITEQCAFQVRKLMQEATKILKGVAINQAELFPADAKKKPAEKKAAA